MKKYPRNRNPAAPEAFQEGEGPLVRRIVIRHKTFCIKILPQGRPPYNTSGGPFSAPRRAPRRRLGGDDPIFAWLRV